MLAPIVQVTGAVLPEASVNEGQATDRPASGEITSKSTTVPAKDDPVTPRLVPVMPKWPLLPKVK